MVMDQAVKSKHYCECNTVAVSSNAKPLVRLVCHCETCQRYTKQDSSDECIFWYKDVSHEDLDNITYKKYQPSSPVVRGTCNRCDKAIMSVASALSFMKFALIPTEIVADTIELPPVAAHVFYHRRLADSSDTCSKHSGYWKSQLVTQWYILKSCMF